MKKLIVNIRFYEKGPERHDIYNLSQNLYAIGDRYARKLREYGFLVNGNGHFNVFFTKDLSHKEIFFHKADKYYPYIKGIQDIDVGLDPELFNGLGEEEKYILLVKLITKFLYKLSLQDGLDIQIVEKVELLMSQHKSELEILHKVKDTKNCEIIISYQINPHGQNSCAFIEVVDKTKKDVQKQVLIELLMYEDIYFLVDSISVKDYVVTIKPRVSVKADVYTNRYELPIKTQVGQFEVMINRT